MSEFSTNLKKLRKEKSLSQQELASKLFVSKQAISKWETGRGLPDTSILQSLSSVLGVSIDELMKGKKPKRKISKKWFLLLLVIPITIISLVLAILLTPSEEEKKRQQFESKTSLKMPKTASWSHQELKDWNLYDPNFKMDEMGYFELDSLDEFSTNIDKNWKSEFPSELLPIIPEELKVYTTYANGKFLLVNTLTKQKNQIMLEKEWNEYYLFIYQQKAARLLYFCYEVNSKEGK